MDPHPIVVTDVRIPFSRLVVIILTWMLASIPAIIICYPLMFIIRFILIGLFSGGMSMVD